METKPLEERLKLFNIAITALCKEHEFELSSEVLIVKGLVVGKPTVNDVHVYPTHKQEEESAKANKDVVAPNEKNDSTVKEK